MKPSTTRTLFQLQDQVVDVLNHSGSFEDESLDDRFEIIRELKCAIRDLKTARDSALKSLNKDLKI